MLHILWLILKFILIILGILLGLLLLAVLLILFCPVRYKASAAKTRGGLKQIEGEGIVSWLFHGVSLKAEWKDQQLTLGFHLFGIPVDKLMKKRRGHKNKSQKKTKANVKKTKVSASEIKNNTKDNAEHDVKDNAQEASIVEKTTANEKKESISEIVSESHTDQNEEKLPEQREDTLKTDSLEKDDPDVNRQHADGQETEQKIFFIKKIYDRLWKIFENVHAKLCGIRKTFSRMKSQVSWWKAFLEHPRVKAARNLVWKHAKFLLKHIFPTRIEGQVTFSFEDPALTGTALAVLGMTIPFHKNCVQIDPRFDGENYLQGNVKAKGRIYGFVFVRAAVSIYFNKNIKYVIKRWKTRRA